MLSRKVYWADGLSLSQATRTNGNSRVLCLLGHERCLVTANCQVYSTRQVVSIYHFWMHLDASECLHCRAGAVKSDSKADHPEVC